MAGGVGVKSDLGMFATPSSAIPGIMGASTGTPKLNEYQVRIQRFVIDGESYGDVAMLENLWTAGLDPAGDIIIVENKSFTFEDAMVVVVTFWEKKGSTSTWRVGAEEVPGRVSTSSSTLQDIEDRLDERDTYREERRPRRSRRNRGNKENFPGID